VGVGGSGGGGARRSLKLKGSQIVRDTETVRIAHFGPEISAQRKHIAPRRYQPGGKGTPGDAVMVENRVGPLEV